MRLMVTRPEPGAARTVAALERLGHVAIAEPMLKLGYFDDVEIETAGLQAILVTSANAVRALERRRDFSRLAALPIMTVGDATARAARSSGFADVISAEGAVDDLAALVEQSLQPGAGRLLYAAGRDRNGDLEKKLAGKGYAVDLAVVYAAEPVTAFSPAAVDALIGGKIDGAVFFSRRTAKQFCDLLATVAPEASKHMTAFCLSAAIAEPVKDAGFAGVVISAVPTEQALVDAISGFAPKPDRSTPGD
ncbi:MAG: uroporphyrinogen-III synthase [Hyphomicrobiales bacterium]|nr:uroporphyrinogen-III synthase [Hyphomicrobiales bacterium]